VRLDLFSKPSAPRACPIRTPIAGRPRPGGFRSLSLETAPNLEASQNGLPETPTAEAGSSAQAGLLAETAETRPFSSKGQ
jgi:hypothetical protein